MRRFFIITAPGLEKIAAAELQALGFKATIEGAGSLNARGKLSAALRIHLYARCIHRVSMEVGRFRARAFPELARKTAELPWGTWLRKGQPFEVRASATGSRLYHSGGVEQRVGEAIMKATNATFITTKPDKKDGPAPQMIQVRIHKDQCILRLDMSGELLHRRGWRLETARAPMRESMAAALLDFAGWKGDTPLVDPMCGAGTWPIEAACKALRHHPGINRSFAFSSWPSLDQNLWSTLLEKAKEEAREKLTAPIIASDYSAKALKAARKNATRAQVDDHIQWSCTNIKDLVLPETPGLVVCNPPYGKRIGRGSDLKPVYEGLGNLIKGREGWTMCCLTARRDLRDVLLKTSGARLDAELSFRHGGLKVTASRLII